MRPNVEASAHRLVPEPAVGARFAVLVALNEALKYRRRNRCGITLQEWKETPIGSMVQMRVALLKQKISATHNGL
jgi:hypothetical protein